MITLPGADSAPFPRSNQRHIKSGLKPADNDTSSTLQPGMRANGSAFLLFDSEPEVRGVSAPSKNHFCRNRPDQAVLCAGNEPTGGVDRPYEAIDLFAVGLERAVTRAAGNFCCE